MAFVIGIIGLVKKNSFWKDLFKKYWRAGSPIFLFVLHGQMKTGIQNYEINQEQINYLLNKNIMGLSNIQNIFMIFFLRSKMIDTSKLMENLAL